MSVIRIRGYVITYSLLRVKGSLHCAPSNLHQATCFEHYFIIIPTREHTCVCSDTAKTWSALNIKIISGPKVNLAICGSFVHHHLGRAYSTCFFASVKVFFIRLTILFFLFAFFPKSLRAWPSTLALHLFLIQVHGHLVLVVLSELSSSFTISLLFLLFALEVFRCLFEVLLVVSILFILKIFNKVSLRLKLLLEHSVQLLPALL